jgi:parallel beta-helix repeat protein
LKEKTRTALAISLLLISLGLLVFNIHHAKTETTTITVPDDYPTIQEAINAANLGDTIYVKAGTYVENIIVNKTVALIGEDKYLTTIDGNMQETTVQIATNGVSISRFTIENSTYSWPEGGLVVRNVSDCNVSNIIITNNWVGLWLEDSSNNNMSNITIANNRYPSWLVRSDNNTFRDIIIANNTKYGVWLEDSLNNSLSSIVIANNEVGIQLERAYNNTIYDNELINNTYQVINLQSVNAWDVGYPFGGNYWSDYAGVDLKSGPSQDMPGSDGIGDTRYVIDENNTDRYPLMNAIAVHDVAITNITASKTIVGQGFNLYIKVQAENRGNRLETVNVTVYINTTIITQAVNLTIGTTATLNFTWNTTGFAKGNYTLIAYAWPVPEETDTHDNSLAYDDVILVTVPGDTNGDGNIDIYDIVRLTSIYGAKRSEPGFNPNCDIDGNDVINIYDVVIATSQYGYKGS